jgi:hypothetical protein
LNILSIKTILSLKIRSLEGLGFKEQRMRRMIWLKKKRVKGCLQEREKRGKGSKKEFIK